MKGLAVIDLFIVQVDVGPKKTELLVNKLMRFGHMNSQIMLMIIAVSGEVII